MHKDISKFNNLKDILIYYDVNFLNYLISIIDDYDQYFYGCFIERKLVGFIHLKIFNNTLFLNNIFLNENFRGGGRGSLFLRYAIENIGRKFYKFSLDVVSSNAYVYDWYIRLGLKPKNKMYWIKILNKERQVSINSLIERKDPNNFNSLYFNGLKVATIVSIDKLIIHDLEFLSDFFGLNYELYVHTSIDKITFLDYIVIEETIRMEADFSHFFKKLSNV
jgi:hypothetical protein